LNNDSGKPQGVDSARARFFTAKADGIHCSLCPHHCRIKPGGRGLCKVRVSCGKAAELELPYYGRISAAALDPIEKKPLYHWRPGSSIFSVGFAGCNLRCPFCQNWHISQIADARTGVAAEISARIFSPAELIAQAESRASRAIAYTYSEPLVHAEFLLDCMEAAHAAGAANVLVSNGCVDAGAAAEILSLTDAANIDLKCFSEKSYADILDGDLQTVLGFIRKAVELGVHVELTTLLVPGFNDTEAELDAAVEFIAELSPDIPYHLSAYHPDWHWDAPPTDPSLLAERARSARRRLSHVYIGNAAAPAEFRDSPCPHCGKIIVGRSGYRIDTGGLTLGETEAGPRYFCAACGEETSFVY
jgi:pyruvate formate lyase activating enzyme